MAAPGQTQPQQVDDPAADAELAASDNRSAVIAFHVAVYFVIVVGLSAVVCLSQEWIGEIVIFNYSAIGFIPLVICMVATRRTPLCEVVRASVISIVGLLLLGGLVLFTPIGIIVLLFPILHFLVVPMVGFWGGTFAREPSINVCAKCEYPINTLTRMACPECGEPLTALQVRVFRTAVPAGGAPRRAGGPAGGPPKWLLTADERAAEDSRKDDLRGR